MHFKRLLNQLYPQPEQHWKIIISISCFISVFIWVFQPFGLSTLQKPTKDLILIGYGGVTFLALTFNMMLLPLFFKNFFNEKKWTVKRNIFFLLWILITIGLGNYFYTLATTNFFSLNVQGLLLFQLYTVAIGIFPVVFLVILTQNKLYKKNILSARQINKILPENTVSDDPVNEDIILQSENGKERLILPPASLLYIEAMGNYIKIYYTENESIKKEIIRCSLKKAEEATKAFDQIVKCHRTYIVNLLNIKRAGGNAQGYLLKMKGIDSSIPVSRKFTSEIKSHLILSRKPAERSI